jgi:hypothetical protein
MTRRDELFKQAENMWCSDGRDGIVMAKMYLVLNGRDKGDDDGTMRAWRYIPISGGRASQGSHT